MRVAVVLEQLLAPVPGGTGRYARELASALGAASPPEPGGAASQESCSVTGWVAWRRDVAAAAVPGVIGPRRLALGRRTLAETWARGLGPAPRGGDVWHATTLLVPPTRAARRIPLVVTIHDAVPWTHPETLTPRGVRWHQAMGERAAREAAAVVCPTAAVAAELARHLPLRRVVVIGEGVSVAVLRSPIDADVRARRLGLPPAYALVVGTLEPRKGIDVAVAATRSAAWPPELPLLVVGPPGWGGVVVPAGVRTLGRLDDADLAVAYASAAVVLVPSRSEGFGLPLLEAMAHGIPVVASDVPALAEVAGGAALLVTVGDAEGLARGVAAAREGAAELGARGLARAAGFSWAATARSMRALYASL